MSGDLIRVVLADDHVVVRAGLKAVLGAAPDIEVVGEAKDGREAVALAERLKPDLVVMDLTMGEMDGTAATKALVEKGARSRVLVLTMHAEDEYLVPLLEAGASGYLVKSAADRELVAAVRAVAHGDTYVQPSAARALAKGVRRRAEHADEREQFAHLTERERDVLTLVARGLSNAEIAAALVVGETTVKTHVGRILMKLALRDRVQAVVFAYESGLVQPGAG